MPTILLSVFKVFGWKTLFKYAWRLAKPQLEKLAKSTDPDWDDEAVKIADEMVSKILDAKI